MRTRWLYCILLMCCTWPLYAQQSGAREVLDCVAATFQKAGGIRATFTVQMPEGTSHGSICLKGDKFLLDTEGVTTWFDGRTQWSYVADADEVNVSEPTAEELQDINPYTLLYIYKQGYDLKLEETGKPGTCKVVMTAVGRRQGPAYVTLVVAKEGWRPLRIGTASRAGKAEEAVVLIDTYCTGQDYPDNLFVFNPQKYPTAEVIDLR